MTMPKQLIIDKTVFQGTSTSKLKEFAQSHFLILPDVLYYECATTDTNEDKLLDRFRSVILSGAYICPSCRQIINNEAETLSPYGFLVDLRRVSTVRKTFKKNSRPYNRHHVQERLQEELDMARQVFNTGEGFTRKLACEDPKLLNEVRKWDTSKGARPSRLQRWAQFVSEQDMHESAKIWLSNICRDPDRYCLSDEWVTWDFLRLMHILIMERTFLRHCGDASSKKAIEHDLQDIKYIALLSQADGLLSRDNFIQALAKAAFSEKDVFLNLDEVPDKYLCRWS